MTSKEIEPRVGMQVKDLVEARIVGIDKDGTIRMVSMTGRPFKQLPASSPFGSWYRGGWEILWIPPTDAERALFRKQSEHLRLGETSRHTDACLWLSIWGDDWSDDWQSSNSYVFDSLALDGADCDNMPEGYV